MRGSGNQSGGHVLSEHSAKRPQNPFVVKAESGLGSSETYGIWGWGSFLKKRNAAP